MISQEEFKKELAALCRKYKCNLYIEDDWLEYTECEKEIKSILCFRLRVVNFMGHGLLLMAAVRNAIERKNHERT